MRDFCEEESALTRGKNRTGCPHCRVSEFWEDHMKKFNYRLTVNISQNLMQLGFRCQLPDEMQNKKIRLQAVFAQRQVDRRFPMDVRIEESESGPQIMADAEIELPYVFRQPPRHKVTVTFALWCGVKEWILDDSRSRCGGSFSPARNRTEEEIY